MQLSQEIIQIREAQTGHSVFGPSGADRYVPCPASVGHCLSMPVKESSIYAKEGTQDHESVNWALERSSTQGLRKKFPYLAVEYERYEWVLAAYDEVMRLLDDCSANTEVAYEVSGSLKTFGLEEVAGTADVRIIDWDRQLAIIPDFKFGRNVKVNAFRNRQLMCYAGIALGYPSAIKRVEVGIIQPPLDHYDYWELTYDKLTEFIFGELTKAVTDAWSEKPSYGPSDKACRWCDYKTLCPARHGSNLDKAKAAFAGLKEIGFGNSESSEIKPHQWADLYRDLVELSKIKAQVEKTITEIIEGGGRVPGISLKKGKGRRYVSNTKQMEAFLFGKGFTTSQIFEPAKMKSPSKLEKLNTKFKKNDEFQAFITTPEAKEPKLILE